jgi:hypothetical protein
MLANAAVGSSKNVVPNRLIATSKGPPSGSVRASACRNSTLLQPVAPAAGHAEHWCGRVDSYGMASRASRSGGGERGSAAPAADVEHAFPRCNGGVVVEEVGDRREDGVAAVRGADPALSAVAVPGGELVGVRRGGHVGVPHASTMRVASSPKTPTHPGRAGSGPPGRDAVAITPRCSHGSGQTPLLSIGACDRTRR